MFHYSIVRKIINFLHLSLDFQFENTTTGQKTPPPSHRIQGGNMAVHRMKRWGQKKKLELRWKLGLGQ